MSTTPHDALFKAAFSQVEQAADELRHVLPPELLARMDLGSLSLEAGSFVDEALRERHTDLLFRVDLDGRDARVYVLFEHQSSPDPWMPLRLLGYMLRIWDACVADGATRLPVIIPVVLHHSDAGWRAPTCFEALFDLPPGAAEFTPHFRFALDDLAAESEAALHARAASAFTKLVLSALQQARSDRELDHLLRGWKDLMRELWQAPSGSRALWLIFRYLYEVRGREAFAAIDATTSEIDPKSEELMESMADYLRAQGRQEGLQEGRREGRHEGRREAHCEVLLRQLQRRFGPLPAHLHQQVVAADNADLDRWSDRVLEAGSLDDIFR